MAHVAQRGSGAPSLQTAKIRGWAVRTNGAVVVPVHCREWYQTAFKGPFQLKPFHGSMATTAPCSRTWQCLGPARKPHIIPSGKVLFPSNQFFPEREIKHHKPSLRPTGALCTPLSCSKRAEMLTKNHQEERTCHLN